MGSKSLRGKGRQRPANPGILGEGHARWWHTWTSLSMFTRALSALFKWSLLCFHAPGCGKRSHAKSALWEMIQRKVRGGKPPTSSRLCCFAWSARRTVEAHGEAPVECSRVGETREHKSCERTGRGVRTPYFVWNVLQSAMSCRNCSTCHVHPAVSSRGHRDLAGSASLLLSRPDALDSGKSCCCLCTWISIV